MRTPNLSVVRRPTAKISTEELLPRSEEQDSFIPPKYEDGKAFPIADREYWKPFFLSGSAALGFSATFIAIIIGLAVVYTQSRDHDGIASTNGDLHYLWTFGPTALFTVILVFWGLLEYQAKLLAPWHAMSRTAPARNSILLDFISAWNVLILPKAIANKQPVPSLAITGSLLIRVLIVLSTGLLVSETVSITRNDVSLATTRKWTDGQDFRPGLEDNRAIRVVTASQRWNLSYPLGTYGGYALPTIDVSKTSLPVDAVATFNTDVFMADLQCEVGSNDFTYSATDVNKDGYPVRATTNEVPGTGASITCSGADDGYSASIGCPFVNVSFAGCDIPVTFNMSFDFTASDGLVQSPMAWFEDSYPHRCKKGDPAEYVGILTYDWVRPARTRFEIEFTALLCKPRYSMRHVPISLRDNRLTPDSLARLASRAKDLDEGDTRMLGNLSTMDLYTAAGPATQLPGQIEQMDATFTKKFLTERFNATAAQLARLYFTEPSDEYVMGQVTHDEERLVVRKFPFIFMEVILVLLSCICLALWFLSPKRLCPREPGSIGGLATILARSPLMMKFFRGTSTTPLQKLGLANIGTSYQTTTGVDEGGAYFGIVPSGQVEMNRLSPKSEVPKHSTWWRPFIVRTPWKIGIITFTISLIVALEVLNGYSSSHDGILALQMGEYVKYSWVYIPTLTMVAVNVLYNMIDFAAVVYYPYSVLHSGGRFTSKVMLEDLAGVMAPSALISCLSKRNITVPATKLAIIAGSMLSIAVSGLYTAKSMVSNQPVSLVVQKDLVLDDSLNFTGSYHEDSIKNLPAILVIDNAPYPKWTYEEFVFPQVALANGTSTFNGNTTSIHARIPAMRGEMNCTMLDSDLDVKFSENVTGEAFSRYLDPGYSISPKNPPPGCATNVIVLTPNYHAYYGEVSPYRPNEPGCPAYAVSVGYVDPSGQNPDISMALCSPYLEKVDVDVTFTNSNFTIDTRDPPRAVPASATVHSRHQFIEPDSFYEYLDSGLSTNSSDNKNHGYIANMDFFFNVLTQSGRVTSAKELMGPENAGRLLKETSRLYGITVAQVLNAEFRPGEEYLDSNPKNHNQTRSGTVARSEYRLVQSAISTHILTALLSFMLICAVVAYSTMRTRDILPNDPCSIAAKASLLASSKILSEDVIPPGSEWLSDKQLQMNGTFGEGNRFRLKWWDEGGRYGIDIESDDDA